MTAGWASLSPRSLLWSPKHGAARPAEGQCHLLQAERVTPLTLAGEAMCPVGSGGHFLHCSAWGTEQSIVELTARDSQARDTPGPKGRSGLTPGVRGLHDSIPRTSPSSFLQGSNPLTSRQPGRVPRALRSVWRLGRHRSPGGGGKLLQVILEYRCSRSAISLCPYPGCLRMQGRDITGGC